MESAIENNDFVNQSRAAELLGVSRVTIWQWLKAGKLQAVTVGGFRMITRSEIERLKRELSPAATPHLEMTDKETA